MKLTLFLLTAAIVVLVVRARSEGRVRSVGEPGRNPRVFVDLDVVRQIESGGNALAVSARGARGPYQFLRPAWEDSVKSLNRTPGRDLDLDYDTWVHDETVSRCIAHEYLSEVLPRYLTARHLYDGDVTGPVPDSLDARLAAFNAGAMAVRRAHMRSAANWPWHLPAETREYISRYRREAARRAELAGAAR